MRVAGLSSQFEIGSEVKRPDVNGGIPYAIHPGIVIIVDATFVVQNGLIGEINTNGSGAEKGRPAYILMLGTEYILLNPVQFPHWELAFRGGYVFSDSPIPETTFKPDVPGSNYHALSIGFGFLCTKQGMFLGFIRCGNDGTSFLGTSGLM